MMKPSLAAAQAIQHLAESTDDNSIRVITDIDAHDIAHQLGVPLEQRGLHCSVTVDDVVVTISRSAAHPAGRNLSTYEIKSISASTSGIATYVAEQNSRSTRTMIASAISALVSGFQATDPDTPTLVAIAWSALFLASAALIAYAFAVRYNRNNDLKAIQRSDIASGDNVVQLQQKRAESDAHVDYSAMLEDDDELEDAISNVA